MVGIALSEMLRRARKKKGLTQEELARHLAAKQGLVSHWEDGSRVPSTARLVVLSDLLGVPLARLMRAVPDRSRAA